VVGALVAGLAGAGLDVDVVTTDDDGRGRRRLPLGVPVRDGGATYRYFARQLRFYTVSLPLARWLALRAADYDVVHLHAVFTFPSTVAGLVAGRLRVPYLVRPLGTLAAWGMTRRRPALKRLSFGLVERRLLAGSAAVQYTSEGERDDAARLGIPHRAVVIPNPVAAPGDLAGLRGRFVARHPAAGGRPIVLFLSRIDEKKGLDLLLAAFAAARATAPEALLVVAGDGPAPLLARLRRQAADLGLAGHVLWAGFLGAERRWEALADAHVFVLPSRSENFAVSAVEAMAAGVPVVVTDRVGVHPEIAGAGAGLVTPAAAGPLAEAMAALLTDGEAAREMGRRGRRLARERYAPETVTRRLVALYREVAATGRVA
jgi:glycosyltransferase involved in cell wall biosynthesis